MDLSKAEILETILRGQTSPPGTADLATAAGTIIINHGKITINGYRPAGRKNKPAKDA